MKKWMSIFCLFLFMSMGHVMVYGDAVNYKNYDWQSIHLQGANTYLDLPIYHIQEDDVGTLWVASDTGLWYREENNWRPIHKGNSFLQIHRITALGKGPNGTILFAGQDGVLWQVEKGGVLTKLTNISYDIRDIVWDGEYIWLATNLGIWKLDAKGKLIRTYNVSNSLLTTDEVFTFLLDEDLLWFGTDQGLWSLDKTESLKGYNPFGTRYSNEQVTSIAKDKKGNLWVGTFSSALGKGQIWYVEDGKVVQVLPRQFGILALAVDSEDTLWIGTNSGLWHRTSADEWKYFGIQGFQLDYTNVLSLHWNGQDKIFLGTARGLSTIRFEDFSKQFLQVNIKGYEHGLLKGSEVIGSPDAPLIHLRKWQSLAGSGGEIGWDAIKGQAFWKSGDTTLWFQAGTKTYTKEVNGKRTSITLEIPCRLENGKLFVPLQVLEKEL